VKRAVRSLTLAAALFPLGSAATAQAQSSDGGRSVTIYALDDYGEGALIRPVRPVAGYEEWLTVADLAPEAFNSERYTYFRIRLAVAADDSVTDCQPVRDAPANLAARACELIRARGRFVHALDASGKAQSSTHEMGIVLQVLKPGDWAGLPPAPPPPGWRNTKPVIRDLKLLLLPADRQKFVELAPSLWADIDAKGRVTRCRIRFSTGSDAGDAELCRRMAKAKFDPARDPAGNTVPTEGFYVTFAVAQ
jgi:hypothetical protein